MRYRTRDRRLTTWIVAKGKPLAEPVADGA